MQSLPPTTYTVTYAPSYQQTHALAKAADFDKRLALLEKALGINSAILTGPGSSRPSPAILTTLDTLTRQVTTLSESSSSSLDVISRRVRQLTQEAEKLTEARKAAKAAQDALKNRDRSDDPAPSSVAGTNGGLHSLEDPEQIAKINALYGTLATIESLSPMLPAVLDRLRSLRAIHADAATASESLARVEKQQEDMGAEIQRWREGLEKVEAAVMEGEKVMGGNMMVVEGWVKELEARMERLGR
jgi:nuclear migration protein JNM1